MVQAVKTPSLRGPATLVLTGANKATWRFSACYFTPESARW